MKHADFEIGKEFLCGGSTYLCTDKGTRTVCAIRVDQVRVMTVSSEKLDALGIKISNAEETATPIHEPYVLDRAQAEAAGWFKGPPYAVLERMFDEDDQEGCEPCPS